MTSTSWWSRSKDPPPHSGLALRAIRSVRSLARITAWIPENHDKKQPNHDPKQKFKLKNKSTNPLPRPSTSSFEAGTPPGILNNTSHTSNAPTKRVSVENGPSTMSVRPSLRPLSSSSRVSRVSSGSSIKWDEECLENVKERRKKEREVKAKKKEKANQNENEKKRECRRSLEGRRRTPLSEVFPDIHGNPILTIEEATVDAHDPATLVTPVKPARPRPVSENLLGKPRPKGIHEDGDGFISILDAATNDLALLVNRLDLEMTPTTIDTTSLNNHSSNSPTSQNCLGVRGRSASITSLRPYAQSLEKFASQSDLIGQQITPWPLLNSPDISPPEPSNPKRAVAETPSNPSLPVKPRLAHKQTMMTPSPAADPSPVFKPLRPARGRQPISPSPTLRRSTRRTVRIPSSPTFGKPDEQLPTKQDGHRPGHEGIPISGETKRVLGMRGTMGVSVAMDDPNSDLPDELRRILAEQGVERSVGADDTPGCPPEAPLPSLPATLLNRSLLEEGGQSSEEDTKRSFDFTGELKKLNESVTGSDRHSFAQQLENAFRTPATVDLRCGFGKMEVPPVPVIAPGGLGSQEVSHDVLAINSRSSSSDGQLNTESKFSGDPPQVDKTPLTLTDIIPPPSHCRSLSQSSITKEDSSVLNSIFSKAVHMPPRVRADSEKCQASEKSSLASTAFEPFEGKGFRFPNRPPGPHHLPRVVPRRDHNRHEPSLSTATASSYGAVIDPGSTDPFDYGLPSLQESCAADDTSVSSVDDTFAFLKQDPIRRRVDSDASSFYFRAPLPLGFNSGRRRHDSMISVSSQGGPPVSLYNGAGHLRSDSGTSVGSVARSYAMYGANGGRVAWWQKHGRELSGDSGLSEFSAGRLGRPELGEKMFDVEDKGRDGVLEAISVSPLVISQARGSVYETIEEEQSILSGPPALAKQEGVVSGKEPEGVYIVDPAETGDVDSVWDDDRGIVALRRYFALRDEAENLVTESRKVWEDTPFSIFATQSFYPPAHRAGMEALLEHSLQNYGPLPSELRPRRIRTHSRPSPYPPRSPRTSFSTERVQETLPRSRRTSIAQDQSQRLPLGGETNESFGSAAVTLIPSAVLRQVPFDPNVVTIGQSVKKKLGDGKRENSAFGLGNNVRPRVGSDARRTALGWAKRSGKSANGNKENIDQGMLSVSPSDSLRINRPRPRGRPTPASQRATRVP